MKNYDLSKYILRDKDLMLFPLTKEEVSILKSGLVEFENYIRLPYYAKTQDENELQAIIDAVDMENDYWFLNTQWVGVDIKSRSIIGRLKLEKIDQFNKIVLQVTDEKCVSVTREDVLGLFYKFLAVNGYVNIVVQNLDEVNCEN